MENHPDPDPQETQEWIESLEAVIEREGTGRAHFLLEKLVEKARRSGAYLPYSANTAYLNTIPPSKEERSPGDAAIEWRIRSIIRWNAMAMVVQANRDNPGIGGHIASFASCATLYDVGFNHFFRAPSAHHGGDLVYFQGHAAPGLYARAFVEGRFSEEQLRYFRREIAGKGLSSYPHPRLMPDFWQFPTVSMGLTAITAIYQARFMRYLHDRGLVDGSDRKVWAFMGDGEMDEPESLGAISLGARERLDNLIFVINCNLQRLDGPVRGNGKIIQELEAVFRGAGWNVIKVVWGSYWDPLIARDTGGLLLKRMEECVDGEYQAYAAKGGDYVRAHFFGKYPELKALVANMSDADLWRLNRGGHDPHKVYAAYAQAVKHSGQPTVILAKTIKGYGMGESGEGQNFTHQQKKMGEEALKGFRDRFNIPISDEAIAAAPFYRPPEDSPERRYLAERRQALGGDLPQRRRTAPPLQLPEARAFEPLLKGTERREISTTMAFVRLLNALIKIQPSAGTSFPSWPMKRAPSAWKACSGSSAFTPPWASSTNPWTTVNCFITVKTAKGKSSKKASPRRDRSPLGSPRGPHTATTACRWFPSISFIPCSGFNASVIFCGPRAIAARVVFSSAGLRGAPRWPGKAFSTRMDTAICSRPVSQAASATIRPSRSRSRSS